MSAAGLIQEIIQNNPPLTHINLKCFSHNRDGNENAGEIILESLISSSISTIQNLSLGLNESWFKNGDTDREGAVEMLADVISDQA